MKQVSWKAWNPGLDNGNLTLGQVRATLPGNDPNAISFVVRLFENPKSPIAFKGAISLERHDCVHVLLGRGLLPQDEAFVIGYTMGTAPDISDWETAIFELITKYLYPHPYNLNDNHLIAYRIGLQAGRESAVKAIYDMPMEEYNDKTLAELRVMAGINVELLRKCFKEEKEALPESVESGRLPL
jgi:hypothetical protein